MKTKAISLMVLTILFVALCWLCANIGWSYESLDELEARKARKSTNTFYSGEDASYLWQPQLTIYKDTSTYHEVWIWSKTANKPTMGNRWSGSEYNWQPWSADGKRIAFYQDQNVGCYVETGHPWFVSRSDGSYLRPTCESACRSGMGKYYPQWSPIVSDIMYSTGSNYDGNSGKDLNGVYRETVYDSSFSSTISVDMIAGNTSTARFGGMKNNITGDGLYMVEGTYLENQPYYVVRLEPDGSDTLVGTWNLPTLDTYWYATINPTNGHLHDEGVAGNAAEGYWFYAMPSGAQGEWWRIALWGSDGGAPSHTTDHTSPYDWWVGTAAQTEVQIAGSEYGWNYGNHPAFTTDAWWSHGSFDRWGTYVVYSDVENPVIGPAAMRIANYTRTAIDTKSGGTQYHCWLGWSDYFVSSVGNPANIMGASKYNSSNNSDHVTVAELHSATTGDFSNPGQSPDGTKMVLRSDWLNPSTEVADLFMGVVYYPYPPEITSCVASGGTVTTGFNWRTDQSSPRTYTTRGWPDEDNDDPCPPRETKLFRLWRSTDKAVWIAVDTVNAEIFTRYDFSDGTWNGGYSASSVWEITDTPGNGTFYYAVTAQEWSGLESRNLSNVYKVVVAAGEGTGALDVLYPSSPGDLDNITASDFYISPPPQPLNAAYAHKGTPASANGQYRITWDKPTEPSTLDPIHHFNIYAEDGAAPDVAQTNLVASYVITACGATSCTYVDWLGNTGGTTQYKVTSVDQQGNESSASGGVTTTSTIATTSSTSIPTTTTSSVPLTTSTTSILTTTSSSTTTSAFPTTTVTVPATTSIMVWDYEQGFDSLNNGTLDGQDSWFESSGGGVEGVIQSSISYAGGKSLKFVSVPKEGVSLSRAEGDVCQQGTVYFAIMSDSQDMGFGWVTFTQPWDGVYSNRVIEVNMDYAGNDISLWYQGAALFKVATIVQDFLPNTWYLIGINWETGKYRYSLNGGGWSQWYTDSELQTISYITTGIVDYETPTEEYRFYLDSISITPPTTSIPADFTEANDVWVSSTQGSTNYSGSSQYPHCSTGGVIETTYVFSDIDSLFTADMVGETIKFQGVAEVVGIEEFIDSKHVKLNVGTTEGYNLAYCIGGALPTLASINTYSTTTVASTSTTSSSVISTTTTTVAGCTGNTVFDAHFENDNDVTVGTPAGCSVDTTQTITKTGATFSSTNKIDGSYSLYLNGYQHRAIIDCSDFDLTSQGSVSFWMKEHATAGIQQCKVFVLNPSGSGEIFLRLFADGKFYIGVTDADGTYGELSTAAISADGTAEVQVGWDLATDHLVRLRLCTDGTCDTETWQTTTKASLGDTGANPGTISIGGADEISHYGWIDNFTIYSSEDCT